MKTGQHSAPRLNLSKSWRPAPDAMIQVIAVDFADSIHSPGRFDQLSLASPETKVTMMILACRTRMKGWL